MLMNIFNDLRVGRFINYVKFAFVVPKLCLNCASFEAEVEIHVPVAGHQVTDARTTTPKI